LTSATEPTPTNSEVFRRALATAVSDLSFAVSLHLADPERPVSPYVAALARRAAELVEQLPTSDD
jgi:hypothetical protein